MSFCPGLTVDLDALVANWRFLSAQIGTAECAAVVKADGYGLGALAAVRALRSAGCKSFFVATLDEALPLRALGSDFALYTLHGIPENRTAEFVAHQITPVLSTTEDVARFKGQAAPCWLQVDTGMNRLGFPSHELPDLEGLNVKGVMSHLACADEPEMFYNIEQLKAFRALRKKFPALTASLSNSSGIFLGPQYHFDLVRPGIALYGGNPTPSAPNPLKPVAYLYARILQIRTLEDGQSVGYGCSWQAAQTSHIATIECGYSDGLHRALFSRGHVFYGDKKLPIVGRVSMDLVTVDVTSCPEIQTGQLVELLGAHQSADDLATACSTISYEVLTSLKPKGGRHYLGGAV